MTDKEILLILNTIPSFGSATLKKLIKNFSPFSRILKTSKEELKKFSFLKPEMIEKIINWEKYIDLNKELALIKKEGISLISLLDKEDYPSLLKEIYSPPILLYVKGDAKALRYQNIAIVGSRKASFYGIQNTQKLARGLAEYDLGVVSGLALGIDAAAHKGAIEAGGITIAVLGNGLQQIYPRENRKLTQEIIAKHGAVISEFPMSMPPLRQNFPRRNRIICGLSQGVVVTEASKKSGALITADFALDEGRAVYSMPGKVDDIASQGTNWLIKQGAKLITQVEDILEDLDMPDFSRKNSKREKKVNLKALNLSNDERLIYDTVAGEEITVDEINEKIDMPISNLLSTLFSLELKKLIKQLPGKKYIRL
ncbi:DNA-processing protein DprA [Candidatus Auribacterota bacterium]